MDTQKAQVVDRLKQANNILVTVSANPSVDQLAGAIGITLLLNKLGKHATAVFSGSVPSVLEFLEPAKTLEATTDSLRDFIISLDKSKADKLRYKVEDNHVRIFITPYRTSISDKDLVFSQGDFNVEAVLALGVTKQADLDKAIAAHGRILHDATVIDVSVGQVSGMGALNLVNAKASSLCEMLVDLGTALKPDVLDTQMATAFLTGIVAQTNRFSNEKTTSDTMEVSSKLLAAGANQQLVANKLQPPKPATPPPAPVADVKSVPTAAGSTPVPIVAAEPSTTLPEPVDQVASDGSLQINHGPEVDLATYELTNEDADASEVEQIHIDDQGQLKAVDDSQPAPAKTHENVLQPLDSAPASDVAAPQKLEPPTLGGTLTASGTDNENEAAVDPLAPSAGVQPPLLSHNAPLAPMSPAESVVPPPLEQPADQVIQASNTLEDLERSVQSPHLLADTPPADTTSAPAVPGVDVDGARDAVKDAMNVAASQPLPPIEALGAQYVDLPGVGGTPEPVAPATEAPVEPLEPVSPLVPASPEASDPTAPPPVPPPMMPPSFTPTPGVQ